MPTRSPGDADLITSELVEALRSLAGAADPERVAGWLAPRTHRASGVTMREAVKYLSPGRAASLLTAYRERRPLM